MSEDIQEILEAYYPNIEQIKYFINKYFELYLERR